MREPLDPSGSRLDQALRCDLLEAVLRRAPPGPVMTWLTRPGGLEDQDLDLAWLRVVVAVNGETGRALPYLVVTRRGGATHARGSADGGAGSATADEEQGPGAVRRHQSQVCTGSLECIRSR